MGKVTCYSDGMAVGQSGLNRVTLFPKWTDGEIESYECHGVDSDYEKWMLERLATKLSARGSDPHAVGQMLLQYVNRPLEQFKE